MLYKTQGRWPPLQRMTIGLMGESLGGVRLPEVGGGLQNGSGSGMSKRFLTEVILMPFWFLSYVES